MILVVLSTHAELARATARGPSYCETGLLSYPCHNTLLAFFVEADPNGALIEAYRLLL